jgi:hypothetical protein
MTIIEFDVVRRQVLVQRASTPAQEEGGALASESDGAGWSRALADAIVLTDEQATTQDLLEEVLAVSVETSTRATELGVSAHDGLAGMLAQSDTDAALEAWKAAGDRLVWKGLENLPLPSGTGSGKEQSQDEELARETPFMLPQDAHSIAQSGNRSDAVPEHLEVSDLEPKERPAEYELNNAGWSRVLADAVALTDEQATTRDLLEKVQAVPAEKPTPTTELPTSEHFGTAEMRSPIDTEVGPKTAKAMNDHPAWKAEASAPRRSGADPSLERPHVSVHHGAIRSHAAEHEESPRPTHGHHAHRATHGQTANLWMTSSGVAGGDDAGAATAAGVASAATRHSSAVGDFMLPATRRSSNSIGVPLLPPPSEIVYPAPARLIARAALAALKRPRSEHDNAAAGRDAFALPRSPARAGRWLRRVTHAYLGRDGLTLWVRDASFTDAKTAPLVAALHLWARAAGMKLGAVICNGRPVFRAAGASVAQGQTEFATEGER